MGLQKTVHLAPCRNPKHDSRLMLCEPARVNSFESERLDRGSGNSASLLRELEGNVVRDIELNLHGDLLNYYLPLVSRSVPSEA